MGMKNVLVLWMALLSVSSFANDSCTHDESNFRCVKYVRNYDADTVTFDIPNIHPLIGKEVAIRVNGVDAPEIKTKNKCEKAKAYHAKEVVGKLLKNAKRIDLENIQRGKFFRIIADIKIDGKSLTRYLLKTDWPIHTMVAKRRKQIGAIHIEKYHPIIIKVIR